MLCIVNPSPVIIVLAAGLGRRFDAPTHKLAQPLGASTVLGQTVQHAIESGLPVVVVTTESLLAEVSRHVAGRDVVLMPSLPSSDSKAPQAASGIGMGHSIAAGVAARPNADGWLVLPGDMPLIRPATLRAVAAAMLHQPVVYAQHQGRRGHPVGFSAELFSDLVQLVGDDGARRIVARYPSEGVDVDDPGALMDVDTATDLAAVRARLANGSSAITADMPR
jgi:molybdenum cofactor cytidylyltransferase